MFHGVEIFPKRADSITLYREGHGGGIRGFQAGNAPSKVSPGNAYTPFIKEKISAVPGNMRYRREVGEATTSIVNHKFVT